MNKTRKLDVNRKCVAGAGGRPAQVGVICPVHAAAADLQKTCLWLNSLPWSIQLGNSGSAITDIAAWRGPGQFPTTTPTAPPAPDARRRHRSSLLIAKRGSTP